MTHRTSPLHAEHVALGATLTDFAGWQMPLRYTSAIAEHTAVRAARSGLAGRTMRWRYTSDFAAPTAVRAAPGLFALSHMGEIAVVGPQAARALDHALVGILSALGVDRARYTMLCQPDGAVIDDVVVYRLAPERFVVVANASNVEVVFAELTERAAGFDARVIDMSPDTALIAVQGPRSLEIVSLVAPGQEEVLAGMRYYAGATVRVLGV